MHRVIFLLSVICLFPGKCIFAGSHDHPATLVTFTENRGQWPDAVRYRADIPGGALFLGKNSLTYAFRDMEQVNRLLSFKQNPAKDVMPPASNLVDCHAFRISFAGSDPGVELLHGTAYPDYKNYFLGNDKDRWTGGVRHYSSVTYKGLYRGIDMEMSQAGGPLKYTFFLEPGADVSNIRMVYDGTEKLMIRRGGLEIATSVNRVGELRPAAWQTGSSGERRAVPCRFVVKGREVSFSLGKAYDPRLPLVIDPILIFSTYSGSTADNWGYTATYDNNGFLYAGGIAFAMGYPTTTGAYQVYFGSGSCDISITKYDTTGSFLIYSTYLGGSGTEVPNSLIVNDNFELFVMGVTGSANFPVTAGCFDATFNGGDPFILTSVLDFSSGSDLVIARFNSSGTNLLAATFVGGSELDGLNITPDLKKNYADEARGEIKMDKSGNIYIATTTLSPDFPVTTAVAQGTFGGTQDAAIFKMPPSLSSMTWSTFLGGTNGEAAYSLVINDTGNIYVGGGTNSVNFPVTASAYQVAYGGGAADGFMACLGSQGNTLLHATYYGSNAYDQVYFIDRDKQENIWVLGQTEASGNIFIQNAQWFTLNAGQFISKFNPELDSRLLSTSFGTGNNGPDISPTAFMVDICNNIYLSGWGGPHLNSFGGTSGLPLSANAFQTITDNNDYYFLVVDGNLSNLIYGTFFGGSANEHVDGGTSRFDKKGRIYQSVCAGCGGIDDFPTTPGAWSNINPSFNCNNAVIKFDFKVALVIADFQATTACKGDTVFFTNTSLTTNVPGVQYHWDFGDGGTSVLQNPWHIYQQGGIFNVRLIVSDQGSCNAADTLVKKVVVLGNGSYTLPQKRMCLGNSIQIGTAPVPDPTVTYQWQPLSNLSNGYIPDPFATPVTTTTYILLISNGLCSDTVFQQVRVYDLQVDAGNDTILCGNSTLLTAHTSDDSVSFHWSSNMYFTDTLNSNPGDSTAAVTISHQNTWFYVRLYNDICYDIDSVSVSFSILATPAVGKNPDCPGICNGSAFVVVNGGIPPYSYQWSNGATTDTIINLCAGSYTVTITDSATCISIASTTLTDPPHITMNPVTSGVPCTEICNGRIILNPGGGTPPLSFQWSSGHTGDSLSGLCAGNYSVTITDDHECSDSASFSIPVETSFGNVVLGAMPDTIYSGMSSQLSATLLPSCTYVWSPAGSLSENNIHNPVAAPGQTTVYHLTITDQYGCIYHDSVRLVVIEIICREPYIYVPNAFTPNKDEKNDRVKVYGEFIQELHFTVFDRWGEKVFETRTPGAEWDGSFRGRPCEPGVYVYYLEVTCFGKEQFFTKGNITLIR